MIVWVTTFARKVLLAASIPVLLASCTVVVDEGPRPLPPHPGPQFCTREYDPVCATRGNERQTFANGCMAQASGYRIIRGGECKGDGWNGGGWNGGGNQRLCTREYRPVCARRGPVLRSFPNACEADSAGFRVVDRGPC